MGGSCLAANFCTRRSKLPGGEVDPESVLYPVTREAEARVDADRIETLGGFGLPTWSLGGLRVWPYVVSSKCYIHVSVK